MYFTGLILDYTEENYNRVLTLFNNRPIARALREIDLTLAQESSLAPLGVNHDDALCSVSFHGAVNTARPVSRNSCNGLTTWYCMNPHLSATGGSLSSGPAP